jgi:hypothetical protein
MILILILIERLAAPGKRRPLNAHWLPVNVTGHGATATVAAKLR